MTYASSGNLARGSRKNSCQIQNSPFLIINKCSMYYTNVLSGKCPPLSVKLHKNIFVINIIDLAIKSIRKAPSPNLSMDRFQSNVSVMVQGILYPQFPETTGINNPF